MRGREHYTHLGNKSRQHKPQTQPQSSSTEKLFDRTVYLKRRYPRTSREFQPMGKATG